MKKNLKNNRGITLVALIITIIVLLILAVVAITSISKSNIIKHAQNARDSYSIEDEKEKVTLAVHEALLENQGSITKLSVKNGMTTYFGETGWGEVTSSDDNIMIVEIVSSKRKYKITLSSGKVEEIKTGDNGGEDNPVSEEKYLVVGDKIENLDIKKMYSSNKFSSLIGNVKDIWNIDDGLGFMVNDTETNDKWTIIVENKVGTDGNTHYILNVGYSNPQIDDNKGEIIFEISPDSFTINDGITTYTYNANEWKVTRREELQDSFVWTINGNVTMVAPEKSDTDENSNKANKELAIFVGK